VTGASSARVGAAAFERKYESDPDPWGYRTSSYERDKYAATLAALPAGELGRTLEVGCSIGVFTELLAPRCERLVAIDFSERALESARERLSRVENVELARLTFPEEVPSGHWQTIVCSEVLYYLDRPALLDAVAWLTAQVDDGASVLAVSWHGAGGAEPMGADEAHELLMERLGRFHALDGRTADYRLDRFDGDGR
jgi:SAM-dependent methyltransferase